MAAEGKQGSRGAAKHTEQGHGLHTSGPPCQHPGILGALPQLSGLYPKPQGLEPGTLPPSVAGSFPNPFSDIRNWDRDRMKIKLHLTSHLATATQRSRYKEKKLIQFNMKWKHHRHQHVCTHAHLCLYTQNRVNTSTTNTCTGGICAGTSFKYKHYFCRTLSAQRGSTLSLKYLVQITEK